MPSRKKQTAPAKVEKPKAAKVNAEPAEAAPKAAKADLRTEYPREFEAGRRARRSGIPKDQAPVFDSKDAKKAWLEGHDA